MADRFRELERPQAGRPKDIVLMATVTGFESLRFPSKSDTRLFSELFQPLYDASSDEARRQAVAALSRCPHLPDDIAFYIATRPITVAAIFLTGSPSIADAILIDVLRLTGPDHARAIGKRDDLSPLVIEALVGTHQDHESRRTVDHRPSIMAEPTRVASAEEAKRLAREEQIREDLRTLVAATAPPPENPERLEPATAIHQALFVRFARAGEIGMLAVALADALASSPWLSERILLDVSGRQLAETLLALELMDADIGFVLGKVYPHLAGDEARMLLASIDVADAIERVESWQRADDYTAGDMPKAANSDAAAPRPANRRAAG